MAREAPWSSIALRKQAKREAKIPREWQIPERYLPQDPPKPDHGPQNVLSTPHKCLSTEETNITESYSVPTLVSAIASKNLSVTTVTNAFCHRAAISQQLTNCLTEILFESAATRAKELDSYLEEHGSPIGPLHGLPVSIKDTFDISGVDTSIGVASLCFKPAKKNSPLVDLLLSLGCVIIAKTNIPQTLSSLDSINNVFGRTMNPINRLLTAGGSSGGEGVLVAMRGSMIGIGTDIGGSIRVPAMCNGIYGFKPSVGRIPYGGQAATTQEGIGRTSVQASAGPIARSVEDIDFFLSHLIPAAAYFGEDCLHSTWSPQPTPKPLRIGIIHSDGNCTPLPPITNLFSELTSTLSSRPQIQITTLPTPPAFTKAQSLMSKLMSVEGGQTMSSLLSSTDEPLVPWMQSRFRTGSPRTLAEVASLQAQRSQLEEQMSQLWYTTSPTGQRKRTLDAIICPVAPHPVPEIERYNAVGYTSSWVLFDYPAASMPVREVTEGDLQLGKVFEGEKVGSTWDERNRELWDEKLTDRRVYLGSPLSVQVVVPRLEEERLVSVMKVLDQVLKSGVKEKSKL